MFNKEVIMNRIIKCTIVSLLILCSAFSLCIPCLADSTFPSEFLTEPTSDMESTVKSLTDAEMSKKHLSLEKVEEYTYDASVYVVEYDVADGFWNSVQTFDYNGITEALLNYKPEATVPVFADLTDENGNTVNRQIADVEIYYSFKNEKYSSRISIGIMVLNPAYVSDSYYLMSYEKIARYLTENQIKAENVFIINYVLNAPGSVAVVKTETDAFILDLTNSAEPKNVQYGDTTARPYSISEYAKLRIATEERTEIINKQNNIEILKRYMDIFDERLGWIKYIGYAIALAIVVASLTVFAIIKLRKRSQK